MLRSYIWCSIFYKQFTDQRLLFSDGPFTLYTSLGLRPRFFDHLDPFEGSLNFLRIERVGTLFSVNPQ